VISTFAEEGAGADVVSGGELFRALRAGVSANKIAFAGVGKNAEEIEYALNEGILYFTVESEAELDRISECAVRTGTVGRIAIRVNPDVDPKTHKYTSTGKKENKFGVDLERAEKAYERAAELPGIEITGIHMHIGSPVMSTDPYVEALDKVAPVCERLKAKFDTFRHIDVGGGLGINYSADQRAPLPSELADAILPHLKALGLSVGMEPGRFLTGNAGLLLTEVEFIKENPFKQFIIVDAAMNDLIRPSLYEGYHEIQSVRETTDTVFGDVVGPICESGDFMAMNRDLPAVQSGDYLAVMSAGAYGFVMASNYNSRGLAAEVMVCGDRHECVHARQDVEDLVKRERIPEW
jgi:diaminopimelate decarboxylase